MRCTLEYWHPGGDRRWSRRDEVDLPVGTQAPAKGWPDLPAFAPYHGPDGWVLRFRQVGEGLVVMLVSAAPEGSGRWEDAVLPPSVAPWSVPSWRTEAQGWIEDAVGAPVSMTQHRVWGRSTVWRIDGPEVLWFKHAYGLPPGEGTALQLASQQAGPLSVPRVVAADGARVLMTPLRGRSVRDASPEVWADALRAVLAFQEQADVGAWERAGTARLDADGWRDRLASMFTAYGFDAAHADVYCERFEALPVGLLPQDLGPCNLTVLEDGRFEAFDWSDVVISVPSMIVDRFFNEPHTDAHRDAVLAAFGDPEQWRATARIALLHETWRYHTELAYLDDDATVACRLRAQNRQQLQRQIDATARAAAGR